MNFIYPQTLLVRGTLTEPLEEAVKYFSIPLQKLESPRKQTAKYGTFVQADGSFLMTICQLKDKSNPNMILSVASNSNRKNEMIKRLFEEQTGATLETKFPEAVERELAKGLEYHLGVFHKNQEMGMGLLTGALTREQVEIWEKYSKN